MKRCYRCHTEKELDQFGRDASMKSGLSNICKPCSREKTRLYKLGNPDKVQEQSRRRVARLKAKRKEKRSRRRSQSPSRKRHENKKKSRNTKKARPLWIAWLQELGKDTCSICGYNRNIRAVEFHHLDPKEKEFAISHKMSRWAFTEIHKVRLLEELNKCQCLCANCHREIHFPELTRSPA